MEENNQKQSNPKLSIIFIIVGAILSSGAIFCLIMTFVLFDTHPDKVFWLYIPAVCMFMIGVPLLFTGLKPYITKIGAKLDKETLDYAKTDLSDVGSKKADIAEPAISKVTKAVANSFKGDNKENNAEYCPYCHDKIDADEIYCENCGKQTKKICENCGKQNSPTSKFCKSCGKEL